jgi:hypothetical protein
MAVQPSGSASPSVADSGADPPAEAAPAAAGPAPTTGAAERARRSAGFHGTLPILGGAALVLAALGTMGMLIFLRRRRATGVVLAAPRIPPSVEMLPEAQLSLPRRLPDGPVAGRAATIADDDDPVR